MPVCKCKKIHLHVGSVSVIVQKKICVSVNDHLHLHRLYTPHIQLYTLTRTTLVYTLTNIYAHTNTNFFVENEPRKCI